MEQPAQPRAWDFGFLQGPWKKGESQQIEQPRGSSGLLTAAQASPFSHPWSPGPLHRCPGRHPSPGRVCQCRCACTGAAPCPHRAGLCSPCESSCRVWHGAHEHRTWLRTGNGPCCGCRSDAGSSWGLAGSTGPRACCDPATKSTSCSPGATVGKALGLPCSPPSCPAAPARCPCLCSHECWLSYKVFFGYPAGARFWHCCLAPPAAPAVKSPATNSFLSSWWLKATGKNICLVG